MRRSTRCRGRRGERCRWPRVTPRPPWPRCVAPAGVAAARGAVRRGTQPHPDRAGLSVLGDEDSAALELQAARETFTELGAQPDLAALDPPDAGEDSGARTASVRASRRSFAWSPPGRATARSPRRWSSASTPLPGTCRTFSPSSVSRRGRPRARSPTSTTWSDAGEWSICHHGVPPEVGESERREAAIRRVLASYYHSDRTQEEGTRHVCRRPASHQEPRDRVPARAAADLGRRRPERRSRSCSSTRART